MHHRALLPNGQQAPLTWHLKCCFVNGSWPTSDDATPLQRKFNRLKFLWCTLLFTLGYAGQIPEFILRKDDIHMMVQLILNFTVSLECMIRIGYKAFIQDEFKDFLNEFYSKIYFDENTHKEMYLQIQNHSKPANIYSLSYMITMLSFYVLPLQGIFVGERHLPYVLTIPFDYRPWPIFTTIILLCFYIGVLVATVIISESYILAMSILNLNGRFVLLEEEILNLGDEVLKLENPETIADQFNERLIVLVKRNVNLIKFAERLESQFTFPLFVMMADSAFVLCLLAFNAHENGFATDSIKYVIWLLAKVLELVVLGYFGSVTSTRVDGLGTTYYSSGWEKVIYKSNNSKANVRTMKLITRAISFNQKPFMLTGLGFFNVCLETTLTVIRVAGSYFTFLCSMR